MSIDEQEARGERTGRRRAVTLSYIEAFLLGMLAGNGRRFGLELVEASGGVLKRGTVYVVLQRMQAKGLVDSEQEPRPANEAGIPRRLYWTTELGEKMLHVYELHQRAQEGKAETSFSRGGG